MKLTDGKRSVEIRMMYWEGNGYSPDFSDDFFADRPHQFDDEGFCIVDDVEYCIDAAEECAAEELQETGREIVVFVEDVDREQL